MSRSVNSILRRRGLEPLSPGLNSARRLDMSVSRPTILLTGFGPFPGVPANATSHLVPRIAEAAARRFQGVRIACEILPTEWSAGLARAGDLYEAHRPALALHFGVAGRAGGFEIEARGRNRCQLSPDAGGFLPRSHWMTPQGPEFLPSRLPVSLIVSRLRQRGIPARVSRDAGGYLCNALLYRTQEICRMADIARSGFVHLPSTLVNERYPERGPLPSCRLSWSDVIDGGLEIIATCLGRPEVPVDRRFARAV
jgi:pyroglutamyl-peptidase